jgi:hypothetical protein
MLGQPRSLGAKVTNALQRLHEDWRLAELLRLFPELSVQPVVNDRTRIAGGLAFSLQYQNLDYIADSYTISIEIPEDFPRRLPSTRETDGRIPEKFHTDPNGTLCLGSPTRLRLALGEAPTLPRYVKKCVLPYLYSFSYFQRHEVLPFGQLDHGSNGIRKDYASLFALTSENAAQEMVRLASLRKRQANKQQCPCGSLFRVGQCHNDSINRLRTQLGRSWFRAEYQWLIAR